MIEIKINRDFTMRPVTDYKKNVEPLRNDYNRIDEVYKNGILIGWTIIDLYK